MRHGLHPIADRPLTGRAPTSLASGPITVAGKFLALNGEAFFLRGVTYGPFAPTADGCEYHDPGVVRRDFEQMAAHGFNTVRTYTPPPFWLLDCAGELGLRVFVGLPWEQHVVFLDSKARRRSIRDRVRRAVASCHRHPAVLGYAVGNEIPAPIVRWHGRRPTERFIESLYEEAKAEHPEALVTYVNFPTTEYLELPFLDFFAWNVYLENPQTLTRYLARLQNLAGERPLVLAEVGLDSQRNGEAKQAEILDWQIRTVGAAGGAGAILFSWTDEWHRSGAEILDWSFGLTDRERNPKPALAAAEGAFAEFPFRGDGPDWPFVSVVVCSYNGARTLRDTLQGLCDLDYPRYEVLVIDDGSTDATASIVAEFVRANPPDPSPARFSSAARGRTLVRLISTENNGLSSARNLGMREARGTIVAYIDDDAYPERHWLRYLAHTFMTTDRAAVGGPNVCPETDGEIARCVSHAPGGPNHVLISDTLAEHIPGCNMAFRRSALTAIDGFDERFRIAGDDVDLCWRLLERGDSIGFHPAAMVWHHSRSTVRGYLRQQYNYGRAEAMLEDKWPDKYNAAGYPRWQGRLYSRGQREALGVRHSRIYHGVWGSSLFQSLYTRPPGALRSLPLLPEWYLLIAMLALLTAGAIVWRPLLWALPALLLAASALLIQAGSAARTAQLPFGELPSRRLRQRATIGLLHLLQPVARLRGRLAEGLHPLRRRDNHRFALPRPRQHDIWSEQWRSISDRLERLSAELLARGAAALRGGPFDSWDLEIRGGLFGRVRLRMTVEEHGHGRQLVRIQTTPGLTRVFAGVAIGLSVWLGLALSAGAAIPGAIVGGLLGLIVARAAFDCATACAVALDGVEACQRAETGRSALAEQSGRGHDRPRLRTAAARARADARLTRS